MAERKRISAEHIVRKLRRADELTAAGKTQEEIAAELEVSAAMISELRAAIQSGYMNSEVERWLAERPSKGPTKRRDRACRSPNYTFESLWCSPFLHREHDTDLGMCACKRKADKCKELSAIREALPSVRDWENIEIERLHNNREHGLPSDHSEVFRIGGFRRQNGWRS